MALMLFLIFGINLSGCSDLEIVQELKETKAKLEKANKEIEKFKLENERFKKNSREIVK